MKIPKKLWIKESEWTIKSIKAIPEHGNTKKSVTLGLCDPSDKIIYLKTGLPYQLKLDTVLHEIIHAIEFEYDFEIEHRHVYILAEAMAKVFVDNF